MPQKKPFTKLNKEHLRTVAKESYSQLLKTRAVVNGYYKKSDEIYKDLDAILRFYKKWKENVETDLEDKK